MFGHFVSESSDQWNDVPVIVKNSSLFLFRSLSEWKCRFGSLLAENRRVCHWISPGETASPMGSVSSSSTAEDSSRFFSSSSRSWSMKMNISEDQTSKQRHLEDLLFSACPFDDQSLSLSLPYPSDNSFIEKQCLNERTRSRTMISSSFSVGMSSQILRSTVFPRRVRVCIDPHSLGIVNQSVSCGNQRFFRRFLAHKTKWHWFQRWKRTWTRWVLHERSEINLKSKWHDWQVIWQIKVVLNSPISSRRKNEEEDEERPASMGRCSQRMISSWETFSSDQSSRGRKG